MFWIRSISTLILVCIATQANAQTQHILARADSLWFAGQTDAALLEYRRAVWLSEVYFTNNQSDSLTILLASRLQAAQQPGASLTALRPSLVGPDSSEAAYRMAFAYFQKEQYILCNEALTPAVADFSPKAQLLAALSFNMRLRFSEAQASARQAFAQNTSAIQQIDSAYATLAQLKLKRPAVARWLSYLLPGSGLWYAGQPAIGALSFGMTGGAISLLTFSIIGGYYAIAATTGLYLFRLFYSGGVRNALLYIRRYNIAAANGAALQLNLLLLDLAKDYD